MQTRKEFLALLGLSLLAGCGGGSTPAALNTKINRDGTGKARYAVTDLGAMPYSYSPASPNFGVHYSIGTLGLNNKGLVVSGGNSPASVYINGEIQTIAPNYSTVYSINDAGQAVGSSSFTSYISHATLYYNGERTDLGTLIPEGNPNPYPYYSYSVAYGINAVGVIVGESQALTPGQGTTYHAFVWQNGNMNDAGTLGGDYSRAVAINTAGKVVGWSSLAATSNPYSAPVHATAWFDLQTTDLGTLPGGDFSDARAINEAGQIVGNSTAPPQGLFHSPIQRGVTWVGGKISDLGTLGGPSSAAYGINSAGQIVGSAETTTVDNSPSPYYYYGYYPGVNTGGGMNNGGAVPPSGSGNAGGNSGGSNGGSSGSGNTNPIGTGAIGRAASLRTRGIGDTYVAHAFLYSNGVMSDLNSAIDPQSGWELVQAVGINDVGQVVGFGLLNKRVHAFLLTPQ